MIKMDAKILWLILGLCAGSIIYLALEVHDLNKRLSYLTGQVECMKRGKNDDKSDQGETYGRISI